MEYGGVIKVEVKRADKRFLIYCQYFLCLAVIQWDRVKFGSSITSMKVPGHSLRFLTHPYKYC